MNLETKEKIDNNFESIKEQIKEGERIGKSVAQNNEIEKLYREHLALKSVEGKTESPTLDYNRRVLNERIDNLAKELNNGFVKDITTNSIIDTLQYQKELQEKLPNKEYAIFHNLTQDFGLDTVRGKMQETDNNVYATLTQLNGYDNILDYIQDQKKVAEQLEVKNREVEADKKQIYLMKEAIKEAFKEMKNL